MKIDKAISIKCGAETFCDWHELKHFQGKLKSITDDKFHDLKESLKKNGLPKGFDIWIDNKGVKWVHDGHHRLMVFKALEDEGWFIPPIPCNIVHAKNKKEAAQMLLISNSTYAHMNEESLSDFMIENDLSLPDLEFLDLPDLDMSQFHLENSENNEGNCDPDEVPEYVPKKAKLGDLFELDEHRLICGDSTDFTTISRLMNGEKANMVFTSPPYNGDTHLDYGKGKNKKLYENNFDSKTSKEYVEFCRKILCICFDFCEGFIFWNVSYNSKSRYEYLECIQPFLTSLHETIIWKKTGMPISNGLTRNCEFIFVFKNGPRKHLSKEFKTEFNLWDISNINSQDEENHRACFPVELPKKGIEIGSDITQIILEPFGGSGSTLIACEKTNRKCFMSELDPYYVDVIIQRFQKFSGKQAYRLNDDGTKTLYDDIESISKK